MSQRLGDLNRHYWRVQRMLKQTGADAVEPFAKGDLSAQDWAGMVLTCRRCDSVDACRKWLDAPGVATGEAPGFCANRQMFAALPQLVRNAA